MKNFLRVFSYGRSLGALVPLYGLFTILGVLFSVFNLTLLIPVMDILFDQVDTSSLIAPENQYSVQYLIYLFKSYMIEMVEVGGKKQALIFVCMSIAGSIFMTNFFRYLANIVSARIRTDALRSIRNHIFDRVSSFHIGYFTNERRGDLISRITNDVQEIDTSVLGSMRTMFKEPLAIIAYFIALFVISFELTLVSLIILPVGGAMLTFIVRRLKKRAIMGQEALGRIVNIFDETIGGMRVVKAFNARRKMVQKMGRETSIFRRIGFSIAFRREMASPFSEFLGVSMAIGILYYGGLLIVSGESSLNASEFMSYLAIYSQIIAPAKAFTAGVSNLPKGLASAERVFAIVDTDPEISSKPDSQPLTSFEKEIEFRNVSFSYQDETVLSDISFTIKKGSSVALVGPSGAGKSTLADLVPRFYDPTGGDILVDGMSLKDYELESLRQHMGIVTQESILFNDTVANNIGFGVDDPSMEEIESAAQIANAHEFIDKMEEGYETGIGESGSRLSGGQRQRISIARAVMKDPSILILDEATSALDSESERLVQDALTKLMKSRTSLVIAHRLSTIQHADEIIVLDQGKIVERGSHTELLEKNGLYKKLSSMQNVFIDAKN